MNRVNTVTGKAYKEDSNLIWELMNEFQNPPKKWIEESAAFIKSISPNQLVTTGAEAKVTDGEGAFVHRHNYTNIDFATAHIWVQNWGEYVSFYCIEYHTEKALIIILCNFSASVIILGYVQSHQGES